VHRGAGTTQAMQSKNLTIWTALAVAAMAVVLVWLMTKMARTPRADMNLLLLSAGLLAGALIGFAALAVGRRRRTNRN